MLSQSSKTMMITALAFALLSGCSGGDKAEKTSAEESSDSSVPPTIFSADGGFAPGESLAFEWSANGFEQLQARYQWMGSGKRDDVYQPNFSLSVPETDDIVWSSSCEAGGKVKTQIYFAPPKNMKGNRASIKFETDASAKTLSYPAKYMTTGQFEGFEITQSASDPMFADMKKGKWAYVQIGEGGDATKMRISLSNAAKSLNAFLPACSAKAAAKPAAATASATYACEDGRTVKASYMGNDTDTPVVRLNVDGEMLLLPQTMSGSGARYESEAAGKKYYWLTKAKEGVFIVGDANDADGSTETTTRCVAR
ncbi:MAG: MliC family protein [Sphingomonadales bacterium]|nr:MliC family protein [Sphingomonadales bacterium]